MDDVLKVLAVLARLVPEFGEWLAQVIDGRTDPVSLRVAQILPKRSASRQAAEELSQ